MTMNMPRMNVRLSCDSRDDPWCVFHHVTLHRSSTLDVREDGAEVIGLVGNMKAIEVNLGDIEKSGPAIIDFARQWLEPIQNLQTLESINDVFTFEAPEVTIKPTRVSTIRVNKIKITGDASGGGKNSIGSQITFTVDRLHLYEVSSGEKQDATDSCSRYQLDFFPTLELRRAGRNQCYKGSFDFENNEGVIVSFMRAKERSFLGVRDLIMRNRDVEDKDSQNAISIRVPPLRLSLSYLNSRGRSTQLLDITSNATLQRPYPLVMNFYDKPPDDKVPGIRKARWRTITDIKIGYFRISTTQHTAPLLLEFMSRLKSTMGKVFDSTEERSLEVNPERQSSNQISIDGLDSKRLSNELRAKFLLEAERIHIDFRLLSTDLRWFYLHANSCSLELASREDLNQVLRTQMVVHFLRDRAEADGDVELEASLLNFENGLIGGGLHLFEGADNFTPKTILSLGECCFNFVSSTTDQSIVNTQFKTKFCKPLDISPDLHIYDTLWQRYNNYIRMLDRWKGQQKDDKKHDSITVKETKYKYISQDFNTDFDYRILNGAHSASLQGIVRSIIGKDLPPMENFVPMIFAQYISFPLVEVQRLVQALSREIDKLYYLENGTQV